MYPLSDSRQKALDVAQNYWQRGNTHPSMLQWRTEAMEAFGFYDGSAQWLASDLAILASRGQYPMTINVIQGKIDSLVGAEIQSRIRNACRNQSGDPNFDELALALTHYLFFVQENQRTSYKGSLKFKDELICGMGWSNIYHENSAIYYEYVHPYNMIPDMDDLNPDFEFMKFVGRKRWMSPDSIKNLWPKVAKYIDFTSPELIQSQSISSPEILDRSSSYTDSAGYPGYDQSRMLVCEIQHKKPMKAFSGIDYQGFYFETFDEEKAENLANSPQDITEIDAERIIRTLFLDNYLLETGPLIPDLPNMKDFTYIPSVWKRRFKNGVPFGILDPMKDVQRDANVRQTKAIYLANSSRMIVNGPLHQGQTPEQITEQLKMADSVIVLPPTTTYDLRDNAPLTELQLSMYEKYDLILQRVTGIFDDFQGKETNASSGVAQKQRQMASIRNNIFAFDSFAEMKQREAKLMLSLIQGGMSENLLSQIVSDQDVKTIVLNSVREVKGKKYIYDDVRTLPLSLYIEEVPDFSSYIEENKAALEQLMSNPNATVIMSSPELLKLLGFRDYKKIAAQMREILAQQQGQMPPQSPGGQAEGGIPPEGQNMVYPRAA